MIDQLLTSKLLSIVLLIVSLALVVSMVLGFLPEETGLMIIGFVFPGGLVAWRDWINSKGWMTYVVAGLAVLGTVALLLKFISPEQFLYVLGGVTGLGAITMTRAVTKVEPGQPILKP